MKAEITCNKLLSRFLSYGSGKDEDLIRRAFKLAADVHIHQKRDNGDPYITHPLAVAVILARFHLDAASICTALLHDVIEDTDVTYEDIKSRFGLTIANLVDGVTKLTRLELQSDRTKQAENFRKLVLAMSKDIRVLLVKLADRLHNMRTLHLIQNIDRRRRIARETLDIYAPLADRIGMERVKVELQSLSFTHLEPEADRSIRMRLNYLRGQGGDVIESVKHELLCRCQDAGIRGVQVFGREKSPYSIWEKMQRRNMTFEQLSDVMAFRILVDTQEDCYAVLGVVHSTYSMVADRFKDYISIPKPNGYQGLHTGVVLRSPRNQRIEVQIRTKSMHEVAENGVAAHWAYKEGVNVAERIDESLPCRRWVQDFLEILEMSPAPDEFFENTKLELYQEQVFCFTPKGQIISLPQRATPVDFAYAVHSQVGDKCIGAKVNGCLVSLRHQLNNGDQVEIMTARRGGPSLEWESFVVTGKARACIRRYVIRERRQAALDKGRAILAKAFRQENVNGSEKVIETAVKTLKRSSLSDLYVAVGSNVLNPQEVVYAAYPELKYVEWEQRLYFPTRAKKSLLQRSVSKHVSLVGLSGVAVHYAACCHPLPGDKIVGVVMTGKGVTIHVCDCQILESFSATPDRLLYVDWDYNAIEESGGVEGALLVGRLIIVAENNPVILMGITTVVSQCGASLVSLKIINRQNDYMEIIVNVQVRDVHQLSSLILRLKEVRGTMHVDRFRS